TDLEETVLDHGYKHTCTFPGFGEGAVPPEWLGSAHDAFCRVRRATKAPSLVSAPRRATARPARLGRFVVERRGHEHRPSAERDVALLPAAGSPEFRATINIGLPARHTNHVTY